MIVHRRVIGGGTRHVGLAWLVRDAVELQVPVVDHFVEIHVPEALRVEFFGHPHLTQCHGFGHGVAPGLGVFGHQEDALALDGIDAGPACIAVDGIHHLRKAVLHEDDVRVPVQHVLQRYLPEALDGGGCHVEGAGMFHHQAGVLARAVGAQIGVGHVGAHALVGFDVLQAFFQHWTVGKGGPDQFFALFLFAEHVGDDANALFQAVVVGLVLILQGGVEFGGFLLVAGAQRDGHERHAGVGDLLDHVGRRVVGDEHHVGFECQQGLDVDVGEITGCAHFGQGGGQTHVVGTQLFLPVGEHAHHLAHGVELVGDVDGLVLQDDGPFDVVGQGDAAVELVGDGALGQRVGGDEARGKQQAQFGKTHGKVLGWRRSGGRVVRMLPGHRVALGRGNSLEAGALYSVVYNAWGLVPRGQVAACQMRDAGGYGGWCRRSQ